MQPVLDATCGPGRRTLLSLLERVHSTQSFHFQSKDAMVPFSPAQPDALPILTYLFCLAQSDALLRLGLFLLLDLMIEANCYQTMAVPW